jgi:hypothetical protein
MRRDFFLSLFRDGSLVVFCSSTHKRRNKQKKNKWRKRKKKRTHDGNLCRQLLFSIFAQDIWATSLYPTLSWPSLSAMTTTNKSCCPYQRLLPPKPTSHLDAFCLFVSTTSHSLSPPKKLFALRTHIPVSQAFCSLQTNISKKKKTNKQTNSHFFHPTLTWFDSTPAGERRNRSEFAFSVG